MAAYVIVDITRIRDAEAYADYKAQVSAGLEAAGGTYLARGGQTEVLEGRWQPGRIVLVRLESMAAARLWWASADYAPLKAMRQASTSTNMILVDGAVEGVTP